MGKAGTAQWCQAAWIRGHEEHPGFPRQEQAQVPLTVPAPMGAGGSRGLGAPLQPRHAAGCGGNPGQSGSGSLQRERAKSSRRSAASCRR